MTLAFAGFHWLFLAFGASSPWLLLAFRRRISRLLLAFAPVDLGFSWLSHVPQLLNPPRRVPRPGAGWKASKSNIFLFCSEFKPLCVGRIGGAPEGGP
jgi:hypothetical protein